MRLLTMLATTVLLAACVHDTDDFNLFLTESGVSLTYHIGSGGDAEEKDYDDPWDTIGEKFGTDTRYTGTKNKDDAMASDDPWGTINDKFGGETVHTGKSGEEDPWDTIKNNFDSDAVHTSKSEAEDPWNRIGELFPGESTYAGKSEEDDPWNRINGLFPSESVHSGKTDSRHFFGIEKSEAVFLSFSYRMPTTFRARVTEVRGRVLKLEFTDGVEQYVIDAPVSWSEGTQLETGFVDATSKKDQPFLGVRFWRTVQGSDWGSGSGSSVAVLPVAWPSEYHASGASLLIGLPAGQKSEDDPWDRVHVNFVKGGEEHDDPWTQICSLFAKSGEAHDDPWNTINEGFPHESVHTGSGKAHDDPWTRIGEKQASFLGRPISRMLFVSFGGDGGKADDPWDRINDNFSMEGGKSTTLLKLMEVRGDIGRFELMDGRSLFAVGIPVGWESGLVLRGEAYLLDSKKMLPLMGAVTWEVDLNLSDLPKAR